jgi:hypothetical protein
LAFSAGLLTKLTVERLPSRGPAEVECLPGGCDAMVAA